MADAGAFFVNLLVLSVLILPLYHCVLNQAAARRVLLALAGFAALYTVAPRLIPFFLLYWTMVWALQRFVHALSEGRTKTLSFWVGLLLVLAPMVLWKLRPGLFVYTVNKGLSDLLWAVSPFMGALDKVRAAVVPIGLSFCCFRAADMLVKAFLEQEKVLSLRDVLFYGFFPPVLFTGPIIEYSELGGESRSRSTQPISAHVGMGAGRIAVGFAKVHVLAQPLGFSQHYLTGQTAFPRPLMWLCLFVWAWHIYLNFSGYSDIAIGCARLFGFRLRENFHYPYFQPSPSRFWANWHMSLTRFAQRNVFVPCGGYRKRTQYRAVFATIMVIALWHDISGPLFVFGLYHAVGLIVPRYFANRTGIALHERGRVAYALCTVATFLFVMLSLPLAFLPQQDVPGFYTFLFFGG